MDKTKRLQFRIDSIFDKSFAEPIDKAILKILRLDENRWICGGISINLGEIPILSDADPDAPILETTTDQLCTIDRGSLCIHIPMMSRFRNIQNYIDVCLFRKGRLKVSI